MKKITKCTSVFLSIVLLVAISVMHFSAETIYVVNGFSYTVINNTSISICGWDNRTNDLIIPDSIAYRNVTKIANWGLSDNEELTSVDLSQAEHLNSIGVRAFANCTSLGGKVIIPDTVTDLGSGVFLGCSSLASADIQANITVLNREMFYGCSLLNNVSLPEALTEIGVLAFGNCRSLEYLEIPATVEVIGDAAFAGCESLTLGVWYGSYGYDYAVAQNIPYVLLDEVKLGDANGDGYVNVNDVTAIQRHAAELEPLTGICFHAADIDGDGDVSVDDATELQRYLAEYAVDYPVGEKLLQ